MRIGAERESYLNVFEKFTVSLLEVHPVVAP